MQKDWYVKFNSGKRWWGRCLGWEKAGAEEKQHNRCWTHILFIWFMTTWFTLNHKKIQKCINYCGEDFAGAKIGCNLNIKSPTRWINLGLNRPWIASWKKSILDMLHNRKIIESTFDTKLTWCIIQLIFITIWTFSICWFLLARPLIIYFYGWQLFVLIPAACQLWIVIILADCHQIFGFLWKNYLIL